MLAAAPLARRSDAVARLLKIHLRQYPEHVVAQAVREARRVLTVQPGSAHRAIVAGEQHARARMAGHALSGREGGATIASRGSLTLPADASVKFICSRAKMKSPG